MKQFGISGECMDRRLEIEDQERDAYLAAYPTRWRRFLHWLGVI